jgi:hypothetical protein
MKLFLSALILITLLIGMLQFPGMSQAEEVSQLSFTNMGIVDKLSAPISYIVNPFYTPDWIGEMNYAGNSYAAAVASAGDVNGDGYADVVIGAPYYTNGEYQEGRAYAYYGSASGLPSAPDWTFESNLTQCELGWRAASAGDVNGDGYDDVLVGSEYCTTGDPNVDREGRAYLFLGSASGLSATYDWMKSGGTNDESFGWSLASAGDVNADGYDDVIVGAPWADYPEGNEGRAYVFYGSDTGLAATAGWIAEMNVWWSGFGTSADSAGDVNGDGYDDVIVGHPGWSSPENGEGRAYVYLGSNTGLALTPAWTFENNHEDSELGSTVAGAGDVNGDGYDDVIVGAHKYPNPDPYEGAAYLFLGSASGLSLAPDWSHEGNQAWVQYSWSLDGGDVNDDGYDDIIIAAPWYTDTVPVEGAVFLYFGSPDGLLSEPVASTGSGQQDAKFGWSAGFAGDVNGDSVDDIIVGARDYDGGHENEGRAIVYYGTVNAAARILLPLVIR